MTSFDAQHVESLEAKLAGLDLDDGEQAALDLLVAAAGATDEVAGFSFGRVEGRPQLGFLLDLSPKGIEADDPFASEGGLGTTRTGPDVQPSR